MNALDSRIRELVAYARERDGEDRTNLFRNLVDLFLTGKAPTINPTRDQLLDVLEALIPHVEADSRRTACELVAAMSAPPMDLVMRLARDRASLVSSLLMHTSFDEDDLIELIERTGREHHQVIASREDLSANVWISLARAAPAAPPFDHQSTLALWSDDLGITQTKAAAPAELRASAPVSNKDHAGATVTPLHPNKAGAAIRILRTDEDLIAARMKGSGPTGLVDENGDINEVASKNRETGDPSDTSLGRSEETRAHSTDAKDPGPGGWAWVSDRDGFVVSISPYGLKILKEDDFSEGYSVLDLLGLNSKLDHPVARAFQRRSAIHDAPIYLKELDETNRHWTLEATPFFTNGGIFEGYEGILTPVVPASLQEEETIPGDDIEAIFLDEVTVASAAGGRASPLSYTDTATVFATSSDMAPQITESDSYSDTGDSIQPVSKPDGHDYIENSEPEPADKTPLYSEDAEKLFSSATASAIRDVIAETLTGASTSKEAKADDRDAKDVDKQAHLTATLDMLEDTIAKMMIAGRKANDPQVRLYGEIASACVRSLKEQLAE